MASTRKNSPTRITNSFVERAELPAQGQLIYRDQTLKGFGLRVTSGGVKAFILEKRINRRVRRIKVGRYPELTAEQARKQAQILLGAIACGRDPIRERRELEVSTKSLREVYREFLAVRQLKPSTKRDYDRAMDDAFRAWGDFPIHRISQDMVLDRYETLCIRGKTAASRHMRFLRALFNFAQSRYVDESNNPILGNNPVQVLTKLKAWHRPSRRRSYIPDNQLTIWFESVHSLAQQGDSEFMRTAMDYLQFLLLTGLRREEAARLTWDRVDLEEATFLVTDTKNHHDHALPLSDFLANLLAESQGVSSSEYVFPGTGPRGHLVNAYKPVQRVRQMSGVEFCLHDLRRTYATAADALDLSSRVLKRLLNHRLPSDVTDGYIVTDVHRLRQPMQQITNYLLSKGGVRATVVRFPGVPSPQLEPNHCFKP